MEEQNNENRSDRNEQKYQRPNEMKKKPGMGEKNPPTPNDVERSERGE